MNQTNWQVMNHCVSATLAFIHSRKFTTKFLLLSLIGVGLLTVSGRASILAECSEVALRNAINETPDGGVVQVQCDGTIILAQTLSLVRSVSLDATGHEFALSGGGIVRVILVKDGVSAKLSNITIQDGKVENSVIGQDGGGGIVNYGVLTLRECVVTNNLSLPDRFWSPAFGGGILNVGSLNLISTKVVNNVARGRPTGSNGIVESHARGGGVYSYGTLNVSNCVFRSNLAEGMPVGATYGGFPTKTAGGAFGGAIACKSVVIVDSTFLENRAEAGEGGDGTDDPTFFFVNFNFWPGLAHSNIGGTASGGGLEILAGGLVSITNTTFYMNSAKGGTGGKAFSASGAVVRDGNGSRTYGVFEAGGAGGSAQGGAIHIGSGSSASISFCTFAKNSVLAGLGGAHSFPTNLGFGPSGTSQGSTISSDSTNVQTSLSIFAYGIGATNLAGAMVDAGHNLSSDASPRLDSPSSLLSVDPLLGSLTEISGRPPILPLASGSPALDAGGTDSDLLTDEKGGPRLVGSGFDLGAVESPAPITLAATTESSGQLSLKWSASLSGLFVLEESADFKKWNTVTQPAAVVDGKFIADIASSPSAGQMFYRLHQQ